MNNIKYYLLYIYPYDNNCKFNTTELFVVDSNKLLYDAIENDHVDKEIFKSSLNRYSMISTEDKLEENKDIILNHIKREVKNDYDKFMHRINNISI